MRIGLVTDTHLPSTIRDLWDEVRVIFAGADLILHGGDIVSPRVLDWLENIAPTLAARGNNDSGWDDPRVEDVQRLHLEGWRIAMVHDMEPEERPIADLTRQYLRGEPADIIITGHTHFERLDYREGVLQINSGSVPTPICGPPGSERSASISCPETSPPYSPAGREPAEESGPGIIL